MGDRSHFRSQHGEDRILAQEFSDKRDGFYVEVGSYNGESYSNTYYLEKALAWRGVLVEADPSLHEHGMKVRPGSTCVNCAVVAPGAPPTVTFEVVDGCRWVSSICVSPEMLKRIEDIPVQIQRITVPARTLDAILDDAGAPEGFDFLSIDVEGHEWPVLQGLTCARWKPRVVVLERNSHFPDLRIMRYLRTHGYQWRRTTGCNDWFYRHDGKGSAAYPLKLFTRYYAPKYLTLWKPVLNGPVKRTCKRVLHRMGMLDRARALLKRREHST